MKENKNHIATNGRFTLKINPFKFNLVQPRLKIQSIFSMVCMFIFLIPQFSTAQPDLNEKKTFPFQITFITPLGTHGMYTHELTYNASINILAGITGGIDGFEISGFGSLVKGDVTGFQLGGFGNVVLGKTRGIQIAGNFNYTRDSLIGTQLSGFTNITNNYTKATQLTGFTNVTIGSLKGFQLAGFSNVVTEQTSGVQLAGFANTAVQQIDGFQISGFSNYSKGNTKGQACGFGNINTGNLKGIQIAGFSNINTDRLQGVQIAGFLNFTKQLNGIQLAPFNYVDSLEKGIPIGIFSIVKNGYRTFEISSNETLYGIASFKTGVKKFYNIISVGSSIKNEKILWGFGYGVGTLMPLKNDWELGLELLSYQINEEEWDTDNLNLHNKFQVTAAKNISEKIDVFGGISWNVNVSEEDGSFKSTITPWHVFDKTYNNDNRVTMYPGITAGIRF